jgi:Uma2 family endonuclease
MRLAEAVAQHTEAVYKRSELVKGKLAVRRVPLAFSKQGFLETELYDTLSNYVDFKHLGKVWAGVSYLIDQKLDEPTLRSSAITFIKAGREVETDPDFQFIVVPPDFAIEFSHQPYSREHEYSLPAADDNDESETYWPRKIADYQRFGVSLLWVIDLTKEVVLEYRRGNWKPVTLEGDTVLDVGPLIPGFQISVKDLFELNFHNRFAKFRH